MKTRYCAVLLLISLTATAADKPAFVPPQPAPLPNLAPAGAVRPATKPVAAQSGNRTKKFGEDMECLLEPSLVANVGSPVEGTLALAPVRSSPAQAQEAYGQRKVTRNEELFKKDLISASDKDELETQTRLAGLERKQQQEVLALRTITSPINGVVVERYLAPGDHIAQEKILKLVQIDPLYVEVIAPVEMFGAIRLGMTGQVRLDPMMSGSYNAKVTVVDRVIDAASGTFGIRLELRNPGNKIPAGIRCNVKFVG